MRYLVDFNLRDLDIIETDVLVVGSGIAGLTAAFECAPFFKTMVLSKSSLSDTATWYAQGGIASAISNDDSIELHYRDTVKAGAGLCDTKVVRAFINESLGAISFLRNLGTEFDQQTGKIQLALEGGHSKARILHRRDYTGSEVQQKLVKAVLKKKGINVIENAFSVDLLTEGNKCIGILAKKKERLFAILAKSVILATGGAGQLYSVTTNPNISTGDGMAMAYRAGAELMDMEFMQFHPTSLHTKQSPRFLITEALRGAGAYLVDSEGKRFLQSIDKAAELASRDIVAQAIFQQMQSQNKDYVHLDAKHIKENVLVDSFPSVYKACLDAGYDLLRDLAPVSPAAHFMIGGIKTDVDGRTTVKNLYASGEVAATGFHGANRLASNSLLEGVVLSRRIARYLHKNLPLDKAQSLASKHKRRVTSADKLPMTLKKDIQKNMWQNVGLVRTKQSMKEAQKSIRRINQRVKTTILSSSADFQLANLAVLAQIVINSALWRNESRGVHMRTDFPKPQKDLAIHRSIKRNV